MIIGIYSKENGVGKTTTAKIIQYLFYCKQFGPIPYGEDYEIHSLGYTHNWKIKSFATKVVESFEVITKINFHQLERSQKEGLRAIFVNYAESCKKIFGEMIWVNSLLKDYTYYPKILDDSNIESRAFVEDNWIIDDVRHQVEIDALKKLEGFSISLYKDKPWIHPGTHVISNNGTIEELIKKVKDILIKEDLL